MKTRPPVQVAVAVLLRADGTVLLADRPAGKPYAGYWEFPGGKIEPAETVAQALARELDEELALQIEHALPWVTYEHDYPHAYVRLHFARIYAWRGQPQPREGQRVGFYAITGPLPAPLLPAALPALAWLRLPEVLQLPRGQLPADAAPVQTRTELHAAAAAGKRFALAGPVASPSDWAQLALLACGTPLPLYAWGELGAADLPRARAAGLHGVVQFY
ncbi:MAG: NUDIX domain-containing protein [Sutterellaceae bacterium]|nr:NUDIX domain-containing protein [Sutterellaceae bacterium]